jgi:hypothetical protein
VVAAVDAPVITEVGDQSYRFSISYTDDMGLDRGSIVSSAISVFGPGDFQGIARTVEMEESGSMITATYLLRWPNRLSERNGTYWLVIGYNQVFDTSQNMVIPVLAGSFEAAIPAGPRPYVEDQNGVWLGSDGHSPGVPSGTDFGQMLVGQTVSRRFMVRNDGDLPLDLGQPTVPAGFTLMEGLTGTLQANESDTFTVGFTGTSPGEFTGTVSFQTNSVWPDFNFDVQAGVLPTADLRPVILEDVAFSLRPGSRRGVKVVLQNIGSEKVQGPVSLQLYLSSDETLDGGDQLVASRGMKKVRLVAGGSKVYKLSVRSPRYMAEGDYHLVAFVQAGAKISEAYTDNNIACSQEHITVSWGVSGLKARARMRRMILDDQAAGGDKVG